MGRPLGAYDSDELDRPDLNKCPDCGCFFATDACTLCGKICPEEMRAGNRAKVKKRKHRNTSGRVQFIPWYHTWWFIALMLWWMFPVGVVLFVTSPYSKKAKIILTAVAAVGVVLFYGGMVLLFGSQFGKDDALVNDSLSRTEYAERCEALSVEEFHRLYEAEDYITMDLVVRQKLTDDFGDTYYICTDREGGTLTMHVRDCQLTEEKLHFLPGDMIRVFGQSGGMEYATADSALLPTLYAAYMDLIG